jgi:hypothetical protein
MAGLEMRRGAKITGNTARFVGDGFIVGDGGVFNYNSGAFTKTSGIIYGDTDRTHTAGSTENTADSGNGHAVCSMVSYEVDKKRNSTAGTDVNLDSGTAANWE